MLRLKLNQQQLYNPNRYTPSVTALNPKPCDPNPCLGRDKEEDQHSTILLSDTMIQ